MSPYIDFCILFFGSMSISDWVGYEHDDQFWSTIWFYQRLSKKLKIISSTTKPDILFNSLIIVSLIFIGNLQLILLFECVLEFFSYCFVSLGFCWKYNHTLFLILLVRIPYVFVSTLTSVYVQVLIWISYFFFIADEASTFLKKKVSAAARGAQKNQFTIRTGFRTENRFTPGPS